MKVVLIYESKYGNTRTVAETIAEGVGEEGVKAFVSEVSRVDLNRVAKYDAVLNGSPNRLGGPTRSIRSLIDKLNGLGLQGKASAVFDTHMGRDFGKAVGKMERQMGEKTPGLRLVAEGELPRCREFGRSMAAQIKSGAW